MTYVVRVAKQNKSALGTPNPNDLIFDSTLNTFKIIKSGTVSGTVSGTPTTLNVAHNMGTPSAFYAFAKFSDGYVALPDEMERSQNSPVQRYWRATTDSTNLNFDFYKGTSANYTASVKYYVFEAPINASAGGSITTNEYAIRVAKPEKSALNPSTPDDLIFTSEYNTLKYYTSGTVSIVVSGTNAYGTVNHNLGYYPYFTAYVNRFVFANENLYATCPGFFSDFGFYSYANVYASTASLFFDFKTNSASGTWKFPYFIFKNNLGL